MSRRLWIADEVSGNRAAITGEHARHLTQVLRAQVGQECEVSTGSEVRRARLSSVAPTRVEFELGDWLRSSAPSAITVAVSIFKFDRLEWAIEKSTELGVDRIIPIISARTETHLAHSVPKRRERWRRIAAEAAEQSRRISPPEITEPLKFTEFLASPAATRIALAEGEQELMLEKALAERTNPVLLAFGPEGGWADQELAAFRQFSWTLASLGPMILRAETAIVAAIAIATATLRA